MWGNVRVSVGALALPATPPAACCLLPAAYYCTSCPVLPTPCYVLLYCYSVLRVAAPYHCALTPTSCPMAPAPEPQNPDPQPESLDLLGMPLRWSAQLAPLLAFWAP